MNLMQLMLKMSLRPRERSDRLMTMLTHPIRTCVGCRSRKEQQLLTRYVPNGVGQPVASRTSSGRGAWICNESATCIAAATKTRAFDRAWKTQSSARQALAIKISTTRQLTRAAQP